MTPEEAYQSVRKNPAALVEEFAPLDIVPSVQSPVTLFMAGAPGAGKTEWAQSFARQRFDDGDPEDYFVHIDADEIRKTFPGYDGLNVREYERATSLAVEKLMESTHKFRQNVIIDGTLSDYDRAKRNVEFTKRYKRGTAIFFVYQKPELAWAFTQAREAIDGRRVDRDKFISAYVSSMATANALKAEYGSRLSLNVVEKNQYNKVKRFYLNVDDVDSHVEKVYAIKELEELVS